MSGLGIHGWMRVVSRAKVHLVAPEGAPAGVITVRERSRQRGFEELVTGKRSPGEQRMVAGPTPLLNTEGEHGVLATIRADIGGVEAQRDVAVLVGDGFCLSIAGVTVTRAHFDRTTRLVHDLAARAHLWLGERRRLVLYPPPAGWHAVARGLDAHWYAPAFPHDRAHLRVFPAVPANGALAEEVLDALAPREVADWTDAERRTSRGLTFQVRETTTTRIAVAADARYIYAARIDGAADSQLAIFDATLDGMHPVSALAASSTAMAHWAE